VLLFAKLKGVEVPLESPPGGSPASEDYRDFTPIGKIPSLDVGGICIPESETICEYIEDEFDEKSGLPADNIGRAQSRTVSRITDIYLSPISSLLARQVRPEKRDQAVVDEQAAALTRIWGYYDHFMGDGPFAVGDEPTLGDCALGTHMCMFKVLAFDTFDEVADPTQQGGRLQTWWEAMQGHDICKPFLDEYIPAFEKMMVYFRGK
ncbi:MAG: glutathione S-transferase family protein, partial [Gammaproteobacteria bacterium]|nr:glutathione S-transferase family protein [Gammaproteobacteria bacterium]